MKNNKSLITSSILTAAIGLAANHASAAKCAVTITEVVVDENSNVIVSTSGAANLTRSRVCKMNTAMGSPAIDVKSCEKWHSEFTAALLSGRSMDLWFAGACPTVSTEFTSIYGTANQMNIVNLR